MRERTMGGAVDRIKGGPRTVCSMVGSGVAVQKTKPISVLIIHQPPTPTHIRSGWRNCCPWQQTPDWTRMPLAQFPFSSLTLSNSFQDLVSPWHRVPGRLGWAVLRQS